MDGQTGKQTDILIDRKTDRDTKRERKREKKTVGNKRSYQERQTYKSWTDRHIRRETKRQA